MERVKFCKLLLQQSSYNKKFTKKLGAKPKLGRRRRRRSWSSGPATATAHWQSANPQARISVFVFLWYLPPSLPSFVRSFVPSFCWDLGIIILLPNYKCQE
jgi:hypothetical protein